MESPAKMRTPPSLRYLVLLLLLLNLVSAQNFVPTTSSSEFPGCGVGCNVLLQAQNLCVPPNVATTSQFTYENCFCQSSLLQGIYSSPDAVCSAECTIESDRVLLQTWFRTFCNAVGQGVDPLVSTTLAPTATGSVVVVTITSTSTPPGSSNTGTGSSAGAAPVSRQSWIEGHWRWILMVGILVIGLGLLAWLLVWLKRRHRRKLDERRAAASGFPTEKEKRAGARAATPDLWGPHQHMHHTHGYDQADDPQIVASGAIGAAKTKRQRRRSKQSDTRDQNEMAEISDLPPRSRQESTKQRVRTADRTVPEEPEIGPVDRDRSRSRRRRDPDSDIEQGTQSEHQRRLREVRGSRRFKNTDPH